MPGDMVDHEHPHFCSTYLKGTYSENFDKYKKVVLRERKRHTAHRIASTRCAALSGGGVTGVPRDLGWGNPPGSGMG